MCSVLISSHKLTQNSPSEYVGPFPEPASSLFVLKWALWADGTYLGDIIPLTQVHTYADLVPRQIHNWPGRIAQLTMWNSGLTSTLARSCILCWLCLRFRLVNLQLRQLLYTFYLMFYCRINDHMKSYCIELCDIIVTCTVTELHSCIVTCTTPRSRISNLYRAS